MTDESRMPSASTEAPLELRFRVDEVFSPSAPVTRRDLFAGRQQQLQDLIHVILQKGQHAVLFGERGVGKTSLVSTLAEFMDGRLSAIRVSADASDNFTTLWQKAAEGIRLAETRTTLGFAGGETETRFTGATMLPSGQGDHLTPQDAVRLLTQLSASEPLVVIIDEYDRVEDARARGLMADTLKTLSDQAVNTTVVLVGVADDVNTLIAAHPSVERALVQIHVPRMSREELIDAFMRALRLIGMTAEEAVVQRIATLSQGLPHYTHLLGQGAARAASLENQTRITITHLDASVAVALRRASESVRQAYEQSIVRARRGIYPEILLAAVLSPRDAYGAFNVAAVRDTLERIVRREVRGLTNQIAALTETGRGGALQKLGAGKTARYRFVNPLLEPFVLMRGLEQGWATAKTPVWLPGAHELGTEPLPYRHAA